MSEEESQVNKILKRLQNNRIVATLIVIGIAITALASFTETTFHFIQQLRGIFPGWSAAATTLRQEPEVLSSDAVKRMLIEHGFYDKQWNPGGKGLTHQYESQIKNNAVVLVDAATNLMWQKDGSPKRMTFPDAKQYINRLNAETFAGFNDWRLPTLEEAMSLMEPQAFNGFHMSPEFARDINYIWTSDRADSGQIWMVYFYDGEVGLESESYNARVRAVR